MKYLEGEELTQEEIRQGLRAAILDGTIIPVLMTAATAGLGTRALLDALVAYAPSPADRGPVTALTGAGEEQIEINELASLATLVFKTTADPFVGKLTYLRVYGGMIQSDSRVYNSRAEEEERLGQLYVMRGKEQIPVPCLHAGDIGAVAKLGHTLTGDTLCDKGHPVSLPGPEFPSPLFSVAVSPKSKAAQAKLAVETATPRVPYRETITRVHSDQYRHKKQTGGAGQFAEVHMRLEPLPRDAGFEYEWEVFGGRISRSFEGSIRKGVKVAMDQGVIAGYPVSDVKAVVYDGKEHPVDSKDIAFQVAGREVFKKVMLNAGPVLLEPICRVVVTVPEEYTGDIMGDLNTKRARVQGMDQRGGKSIITALAPLAEMQRYATDMRSLTQGRGIFTMELERYEEVPAHMAQPIIEAHRREKQTK